MERIRNIFNNGTIWLRADFHLHTKADREFLYKGDEDYFVSSYIDKLKQEKIRVGLITNHNKFDEAEFKELRKNADKEDIYLIPGIEFSIKDGAKGMHLLIAFDDSWIVNNENKNHIQTFIDSAFIGISNYNNSPYSNSNFNMEETYKKLNEFGYDYFFIMAHVDDSSGLFQELEGRNLQSFLESEPFKNRVYAVQKSRKRDNRKHITDIAFVEGTDNAEKGIDGLGRGNTIDGLEQKTYIKIGDFSFEALKYALIDKEHRVKNELPHPSNSYIKSIHFDGGKLSGQTIDLSPELNNFIGIRGSGKSSIIETIRYALDILLPNSAADVNYKNELIKYILGSGGKVTLYVVDKHGKEFRVEKIYGQKENIYDENNQLRDCSISAIFDTPIYFGQKDLSNKKEDFESDLLKRLVGNRLENVSGRIENKKREIKTIITEIKKIHDLAMLKEETERAIKDAEQKLQYFKEQGIEEKLKIQIQFENDNSTLVRSRDAFISYLQDIDIIIRDHEPIFSNKLASSEINATIFEMANSALADAKVEFENIKILQEKNKQALQRYEQAISLLDAKREEMKEEFAKIKREINSDTLNPDTFLTLTRIVDTSRIKLQEISKLAEKQTELNNRLLTALHDLNELWREEYNILHDETQKINQANHDLSIEIEFKGQKKHFLEKLKSAFYGTGIRDTTYQNISQEFADFIEIYRNKASLSIPTGNIEAFRMQFDKNMDDLLTFRTKDQVIINYKKKPLGKHSLGQRASALILFLLAQKDNDVLLIDQPEDDLDNQTIYDEVIAGIQTLKGQMQFIFATHNANIPVLGDSEKILSCSFEDSSVISVNAGTIDTPSIQKSIVEIMEGGEDAFNKRKNIYSIWNIK